MLTNPPNAGQSGDSEHRGSATRRRLHHFRSQAECEILGPETIDKHKAIKNLGIGTGFEYGGHQIQTVVWRQIVLFKEQQEGQG